MGLSVPEIAKKLSRHRSSVYRELNRNKEPEGYFPVRAQEKKAERNSQKYTTKIEKNRVLRDYITQGLKKGWSPEQIAGRMRYKKLNFYTCPESIYQFIYRSKSKELYNYLPYKRPKRRKRRERKERPCRYGGKLRLITQRPEIISSRKHFGHWEGDTIAFSGTREKAVTTLVERKSRVLYLIKNDRKYSRGVMDKIKTKLSILPKKMFKTITFDQGIEFSDYNYLEQESRCKVYYCQTHSPWQKGSNENMNGRIRRYLPREVEIDKITQRELDQLALKMNQCPRKCLGFKTPNELFIQQHKNVCRTSR
jgi:IS30 family transposase